MSADSSYCSVLSRSLLCQGVRISLAAEKPPNLRPWYPQPCCNETNVQWWVSVCNICQQQCRCQSTVSCWLPTFAYVLAVVLAWAHNDERWREDMRERRDGGVCLLLNWPDFSALLLCFFSFVLLSLRWMSRPTRTHCVCNDDCLHPVT